MAGPTRDGGTDGGAAEDPREDDIAAQWADLTARLGELHLPPAPGEEDDPPAVPAAYTPPVPGPRDFSPREPGPDDEDDDDPGRDLVDGFQQPDPEPLSGAHPVVALGWSAVAASIVVMVLCAVVWRSAPGLVWVVSGAALLGGSALLLWQMPAGRDADDYDDGAVV
ncbi:hypothetical protein [Georgenia wangjunii]|uniref:hypothetical protein n=1 Tax=Georgenia wangjunii TaxID=3117730 RepID=UPI002F25F7EE